MTLLLLLGPAVAGEATLTGPTEPVAPAESVSFSFVLDGLSWLDGCAPIELERQEGVDWVAQARKPCPASVAATQVDGALAFSVPAPPVGTYRAAVTFGLECVSGRAFPVAACKSLSFVRSAPFTVAVPAAPPEAGR